LPARLRAGFPLDWDGSRQRPGPDKPFFYTC
jgi:hypothetical protein